MNVSSNYSMTLQAEEEQGSPVKVDFVNLKKAAMILRALNHKLRQQIVKLIDERGISHEEVWVMAFNKDISSSLKGKLEKRLPGRVPQVTTVHSFILYQTLAHGSALLGTEFQIGDMLGKTPLKKLLHQPIAERLRGQS